MGAQDAASAAIAVIGASVRGTSLVERLLAGAPALLDDRHLVVHVIDPYPPGSGRIWRAGQSPYLIMNTVAAQSTVFADETVALEGPQQSGPTLAEWCALLGADPSIAADAPAEVIAEAQHTQPWSSPSRLLYGYYLRWCFDRIVARAPGSVTVRVHAARAVDIVPSPHGYDVRLERSEPDAGAGEPAAEDRVRADAVLLAVGWLPHARATPDARIVSPGNPIDQDVSVIADGSVVAVRGLGMGFFDTVSQLTEQRGGRFVDLPDGSVRYEPTGNEPTLVAGSGRGVPYRAKPAFGAPPFFPEQRILRAALPHLQRRRPVDFALDVLPLIERDAAFDYYRALARVRPGSVRDAEGLREALRDGTEPVDALAAAHVPDPADRLSLRGAEHPLAARSDASASIDDAVAEIVRQDIREAALGMDSPLKLALHSYAAARSALIGLVEFGGLTPESIPAYRRFLAVAASFGSGPPLRRARQLLAAHDAGIVRFAGPGFRLDASGPRIVAEGLFAPAEEVDAVVEAWLPGPTVEHTGDPLVRSLLARGLARAWRFADGTASEALDIRAADGALIGAGGAPSPGLFSVGVPHEDIRVFTIIAPVPGTNSTVLRETDAAARAALRAAATRTPVPPAALESLT